MKRPITTAEYFNLICDTLRRKKQMPDEMLDYALPTYSPVPIKTYEFNIRNNLDFGENEGIYLDLSIELIGDGERQIKELGTFKTLQRSDVAMRTMAQLLADFIVADRDYVRFHLDDFNWTGVDVYAFNGDGRKSEWGYSCSNQESAKIRKDKLLERFLCVIIRDNATRRISEYRTSRNYSKSDVA